MRIPTALLKIETLGSFRITLNGKPVATDWPSEGLKILFCSLLSPLDLCVNWGDFSLSIMGVAITHISRRRLEENYLKPLVSFMIKEFGFNPLYSGEDGISINRQCLHFDAQEFYCAIYEGLRLLSIGDDGAAHKKFICAKSLYDGSYLLGMSNKIIDATRNELESLYQIAVMDELPLVRKYVYTEHDRRAEAGRTLTAS